MVIYTNTKSELDFPLLCCLCLLFSPLLRPNLFHIIRRSCFCKGTIDFAARSRFFLAGKFLFASFGDRRHDISQIPGRPCFGDHNIENL